MANVSRTPDYYGYLPDFNSYVEPMTGQFRGWYGGAQAVQVGQNGQYSSNAAAYRLDMPQGAAVTACSLSTTLTPTSTLTQPFTLRCSVISGTDPRNNANILASQTYTVTSSDRPVTKSFSFSGLNIQDGVFCFRISVEQGVGYVNVSDLTAGATYTMPALSVSLSPATAYDIPSSLLPDYRNTVVASIGNLFGQKPTVTLTYNSATVTPEPGILGNDRYEIRCSGLYAAFGATGSSIRVNVSVSDALGRTATGSFTLLKPQGSTATATAPKSTTADGTMATVFSWSMSDAWGAQTGAELQWSTDNATWESLASVSGSAMTWTAPALKFPAGTIYWRVRVTNTFGVVGPWSNAVSFTVRYDAVSQVIPVNSQTSGGFNRSVDKTFQVGLETSGQVYTPFTIASAVFYWREGASGTWTDVSMTPAADNRTAAVTIAADTFPTGTIQWYAEATDNTNRTTETAVYTLTALVAEVQAVPISPINTVESGNGTITLRWSYASVDGSLQTAARVQWRQNPSAEWVQTQINDSAVFHQFVVPANTFDAGVVYWRVAARNSAGTWGPYSDTVSFKVLSAPHVAGVTGDGKPFLTISWQTPTQSEYGQQAYKIEVDGKLYGPYFGADVRSYTLKEPLEDGTHEVKVAAQNRFGLWSEWAEGNVVVTNNPGSRPFNVVAAAAEGMAVIYMANATIAPIITRQPQDYQRGTDGNAYFQITYKTWANYSPASPGITSNWQYRTGPNAAWYAYTGTVLAGTIAMPAVTSASNAYQYRVKIKNAVGEVYSDPATFYYREPLGVCSDIREGEWQAPTGYFMIYRNGKLIGKTYENFFVDRAAIGQVEYQVIQVLKNGCYRRGAVTQETADVHVDCPTLFPLYGSGAPLPLTLSENSRRTQEIQRSGEVIYTQYEGATFPEAEIGEHKSLSISGDCAWTWDQKDDADAFEALLGLPVIYKTPGGEMVVGVLDGFTQRDAHFYRTARFTIQQMDWRDFRDEP